MKNFLVFREDVVTPTDVNRNRVCVFYFFNQSRCFLRKGVFKGKFFQENVSNMFKIFFFLPKASEVCIVGNRQCLRMEFFIIIFKTH